jgi:N-acetylneuraminate synthase
MNRTIESITIAGRRVGPGAPCFVIAEAGVNHNGCVDRALQLVDAAAGAGADAVKFQTFCAESLVTPDAPKAAYQNRNHPEGSTQLGMLRQLELSRDDHVRLVARCRERGMTFMSTPFDERSADLLESLDVPVYKIPSGEITNLPLLAYVAAKGKPLIVSTGMSTLGEVEAAVEAVTCSGGTPPVLLHCVSNYPAEPAEVNLRAMQTLATAFGVPVGYSDHTLGLAIGTAAVALGACVLEKHFTLARSLPGPDHRASLEPGELAGLIRAVRDVEAALGDGRKIPTAGEADTAAVARKSLVAACDISAGTVLTDALLAARRPGTGLPPTMRSLFAGRIANQDIPAGAMLRPEMVA